MPSRYEISPTVQKKLRELNTTAEEVIRKALDLKPDGLATSEGPFFPEGTAFLVWYKDRPYWGHIKDGAIDIEGKKFTSVSGAAAEVTGRATTNGWSFWTVRLPGKTEFVPIMSLRK